MHPTDLLPFVGPVLIFIAFAIAAAIAIWALPAPVPPATRPKRYIPFVSEVLALPGAAGTMVRTIMAFGAASFTVSSAFSHALASEIGLRVVGGCALIATALVRLSPVVRWDGEVVKPRPSMAHQWCASTVYATLALAAGIRIIDRVAGVADWPMALAILVLGSCVLVVAASTAYRGLQLALWQRWSYALGDTCPRTFWVRFFQWPATAIVVVWSFIVS